VAVLDNVTLASTGRARMNFANTHLANAHRFAMLVHEVETSNAGQPFGPFIEDIMANGLATVMSSMAALEAYVNEVTFDPAAHFPAQAPDLVASSLALIARQPILERIAFLSVLNGRARPEFGRNPGQGVAALVDLRNALVHFRPEWPDEQKAHAKLGDRLRSKFALSPFFDASEPLFPRACISYGCSKWAVESVRDFIVELADDNGWTCGIKKMLPKLGLP